MSIDYREHQMFPKTKIYFESFILIIYNILISNNQQYHLNIHGDSMNFHSHIFTTTTRKKNDFILIFIYFRVLLMIFS